MKVLNIEEHVKTDGKPYWQVTIPKRDGTASKSPLIEWEKPTYKVGDELPFEVVLIKPDKGEWYYKRKEGSTQVSTPKPRYQKTDEDRDAIMLQVAFKGAIEADGYWYVPDGKSHTDRVIQNTSELFAGLLMMKPEKKEEHGS